MIIITDFRKIKYEYNGIIFILSDIFSEILNTIYNDILFISIFILIPLIILLSYYIYNIIKYNISYSWYMLKNLEYDKYISNYFDILWKICIFLIVFMVYINIIVYYYSEDGDIHKNIIEPVYTLFYCLSMHIVTYIFGKFEKTIDWIIGKILLIWFILFLVLIIYQIIFETIINYFF